MTAIETRLEPASSVGILVTPGADSDAWLSKARAFQQQSADPIVQISMSVDEALMMGVDDWLVVLTEAPNTRPEFRADQARDLSRLFSQCAERGGNCKVFGEGADVASVRIAEAALIRDSQAPIGPTHGPLQSLAVFRADAPATPIDVALLRMNDRRLVPGAPLATFDLTGRPEVLVWGPHITLPPGKWRLSIGFEVDRAASAQSLAFEWGDLDGHERHEVSLGRAGRYDIVLDRDWDVAKIAELRVSAAHAVFAGCLRVISVLIGRAPTEQPQAALNQL
ncbi:hypothetical protein [Brevundimonas sp. C43]|uniref:hypothetical protein n=1 Tax=Brevundimonas sp. C43 TaxID=3068314 RepID=UPI00273F88FA|nr:hypothetical protein [Brevundimonas sp. C43]